MITRLIAAAAAAVTAVAVAAIGVPSALASTTLYDQNDAYGYTQIISDGSLGRQAADDFTVPAGSVWTISEIDLTGEICLASSSVTVQVYSDSSGLPGTILQTDVVTTGDGLVQSGCTFVIPVDLTALDPGHYWLSVITSGLWYWSARYPINGSEPAFQSTVECGSGWTTIRSCVASWWVYDLMFALQGSSLSADTTPPAIAITTPASGTTYYVNQVVAADYSCSDSGSGVATCFGDVADGSSIDTSASGSHTFTVNATDNAGNAASASVAYSVLSAGDLIVELKADIAGMGLSRGTGTSLRSLLDDGLADLQAGDEASAVTTLNAFVKVVAAQVRAKKLTSSQAAELTAAASKIIAVIGY